MAHPVLLRHKNTTPGTFMEALESGFPLITMAIRFILRTNHRRNGGRYMNYSPNHTNDTIDQVLLEVLADEET